MKENQKDNKREKEEKDFFGDKGYLSRSELRQRFKKSSPRIPGSSKWYTREQRVGMEKELFGKKYGEYITPQEYKEKIHELREEKYKTKSNKKRIAIDRKIRYLKRLGGF